MRGGRCCRREGTLTNRVADSRPASLSEAAGEKGAPGGTGWFRRGPRVFGSGPTGRSTVGTLSDNGLEAGSAGICLLSCGACPQSGTACPEWGLARKGGWPILVVYGSTRFARLTRLPMHFRTSCFPTLPGGGCFPVGGVPGKGCFPTPSTKTRVATPHSRGQIRSGPGPTADRAVHPQGTPAPQLPSSSRTRTTSTELVSLRKKRGSSERSSSEDVGEVRRVVRRELQSRGRNDPE